MQSFKAIYAHVFWILNEAHLHIIMVQLTSNILSSLYISKVLNFID